MEVDFNQLNLEMSANHIIFVARLHIIYNILW